jgi:hypothetical protein
MSKDYFDHVQDFSRKMHGSTMSNDEIVGEFAIRGFESRVAMLHQIETYEEPGEVTDVRKAASRMNLKRRLNQTHHALRQAGK